MWALQKNESTSVLMAFIIHLRNYLALGHRSREADKPVLHRSLHRVAVACQRRMLMNPVNMWSMGEPHV
jgi:hypothetical protein